MNFKIFTIKFGSNKMYSNLRDLSIGTRDISNQDYINAQKYEFCRSEVVKFRNSSMKSLPTICQMHQLKYLPEATKPEPTKRRTKE